jgi:hypothetical protein
VSAFPLSFRLHQQKAKKAEGKPGVHHFPGGEIAMPKKSLARYVSELREELLARNCPPTTSTPSNNSGVQLKAANARSEKVNGSGAGAKNAHRSNRNMS